MGRKRNTNIIFIKMDLRLDIINLAKWNERIHPLEAIKQLCINYKKCESVPIGDCWVFYECTNVPKMLPSWIEEIKYNFNKTH